MLIYAEILKDSVDARIGHRIEWSSQAGKTRRAI